MYQERISNLLNVIDRRFPMGTKEREHAIDIVEIGLELFPRCASATYSRNVTLDMAKLQVGPSVHSHMQNDLNDSNMWLCAATIKAIKNINELCNNCGVEPLYDGSMDTEYIQEFCGLIVTEYFNDRLR